MLLAGGKGRRLDGRDKGLETLDGRPMIAYVIDTLAPQVGDALISANRNLERYRRTQARAIRRCVTL
ncbi:MAG: NTP transferase domain-containing protein [Thiogranum sp.]